MPACCQFQLRDLTNKCDIKGKVTNNFSAYEIKSLRIQIPTNQREIAIKVNPFQCPYVFSAHMSHFDILGAVKNQRKENY
jgi:hypothetical protein